MKSPQPGVPEFQCRDNETAKEEQFEHVRHTIEESATGHLANENNQIPLEGFIPIQSYEEREVFARESAITGLSPAHNDPPPDRAVDTSTAAQSFASKQEQADMDISPAHSINEFSDTNQQLLYENEDDTVGELPFQDALSAVFQKRAKLEQVLNH